jgi:hypothetical protein
MGLQAIPNIPVFQYSSIVTSILFIDVGCIFFASRLFWMAMIRLIYFIMTTPKRNIKPANAAPAKNVAPIPHSPKMIPIKTGPNV